MEPFVEKVYLLEVLAQADAAIRAINAFNQALNTLFDAGAAHDHAGDFLNRAAMIAKILKPTGGKDPNSPARRRGRYLRYALNVADDDAILERHLRDLLEHIDESIDRWAAYAALQGHFFIDKNIGDGTDISIQGSDLANCTLRNYNPRTKTYSVRGEHFDLQALASAISRVAASTHARLAALATANLAILKPANG